VKHVVRWTLVSLLVACALPASWLAGCHQAAPAGNGPACETLDPGSCLANASCTLTSCDACCGQPIQLCGTAGSARSCPACNTDCMDRCSGATETACRAEASCLPVLCPCQGSTAYAGCIDPRLASVPACGADCMITFPDGGTDDAVSDLPEGHDRQHPDVPVPTDNPNPTDSSVDCHTLDPATTCSQVMGCVVGTCPGCPGMNGFTQCLNPGENIVCPAIACATCVGLDEASCWADTACTPDYCTDCTGVDNYMGCLDPGSPSMCPVLGCPDPGCANLTDTCSNNPACHVVFVNGVAHCANGATADCDPTTAFCNQPPPQCDGDQSAAVSKGCWAGCVATTECAP
jgi:hypothetical protein